MDDQEILEIVDEIVDDMDPPRIEAAAERFDITLDHLVNRIVNELKTRLDQ